MSLQKSSRQAAQPATKSAKTTPRKVPGVIFASALDELTTRGSISSASLVEPQHKDPKGQGKGKGKDHAKEKGKGKGKSKASYAATSFSSPPPPPANKNQGQGQGQK